MALKFKVDIECENAAFEGDPQYEVARILRVLADRIINEGTPDRGDTALMDIGGNKVGRAWWPGVAGWRR